MIWKPIVWKGKQLIWKNANDLEKKTFAWVGNQLIWKPIDLEWKPNGSERKSFD